jgi:uncharacterized protein YqhQ
MPETPAAASTKSAARPYIGGQAVIEGVMMRSPASISIVCRRKSGELVVREKPMPRPAAKGMSSWPLFRGMATLVESLKLGSQALRFSAELYEKDMEAEEAAEKKAPKGPGTSTLLALSIVSLLTAEPDAPAPEAETKPAPTPAPTPAPAPLEEPKKGGGLGWLPLVFAIFLFVALPQAGAEGLNRLFHLGLEVTSPGYQALTGTAKLVIVVGYLLAIRQIDDIRRVFQYHGAEHKSISTYEAEEDLTVANARAKTTMHPRCGTTFLVMVAMVSILVFSVMGAFLPKLPGGRLAESLGFFLMKLPFLPLVAAITYEIQRVFARYCTTGPLRALLWPGFLVQKITTAEPDDAQLEVALGSLRAALWREAATEAPVTPDRTFSGYAELIEDPGYAEA